MKKRLLCITLLLVMVIGVIPVSAKSKSNGIDKYLESSFDVYNVPIVDSFVEFKDMIDNKKIKPAIEDKGTSTLYTVTAKKNGCLLIYGANHYTLSDVSDGKAYAIWNTFDHNSQCIPIRKGDTFAFQNTEGGQKAKSFYIGFVPEDNIFIVDESKKNSNDTLTFVFGNIYGKGTELSISASNTLYPTRQIISEDVNYQIFQTTKLYSYSSVLSDDGDAILTLPKSGEYSLTFRVKLNDEVIIVSSMILDTNAYINPTLDILETPISAITGTNVIVGYGEPYATVYVSYKNKKYSSECDKNGIYRVVLNKNMEKGVKFKIWQTDGKLTSKKATFRVTDGK